MGSTWCGLDRWKLTIDRVWATGGCGKGDVRMQWASLLIGRWQEQGNVTLGRLLVGAASATQHVNIMADAFWGIKSWIEGRAEGTWAVYSICPICIA